MACEPQAQAAVYEAAWCIASANEGTTLDADVTFFGHADGFYAWFGGSQWKVLEPQGPNHVLAVIAGGIGAVDFIVVGPVQQLLAGARLLAWIRDLILDFHARVPRNPDCLERKPVTVSFDHGYPFQLRAGSSSLYAHRRTKDRKWTCQPVPMDLAGAQAIPGSGRHIGSAVITAIRQHMREYCSGL